LTTNYNLIEEELKRSGDNISKVARALGVSYFGLKDRQQRLNSQARATGLHPATGPVPEDISALGRPGFQHNVVAVKRQGGAWPAQFAAVIADARQKYDTGTHEMFQTSDNGWVVLYLIPRLKATERRRFFSSLSEVA
jgi:transposase-like protein